MVNILLVSHSYQVAKSLQQLLKELQQGNFIFAAIGGINDGQDFGTNPLQIKDKVEELLLSAEVLIICDMGSSVMNAQMALEFLSAEQQKHVDIANGPFFEGLLVALTSNNEKLELSTLKTLVDKADTAKLF